MAQYSSISNQPTNQKEEEEKVEDGYEKTYTKYTELAQTLPEAQGWMTPTLVQYQGFWLSPLSALKGVLLIHNHFKARPTDIILATSMKCGTTWLRALMFAAFNRSRYDLSDHPLLKTGPHGCFPFLDAHIYSKYPVADLETLESPRLFSTHIPYSLLPDSVKASGCKFVTVCRDPKDVLISKWKFAGKLRPNNLPPISLRKAFDLFCEGVSHYGPYWDHVLEYWKLSMETPDRVLFLRYEDLKRDPAGNLRRLSEFMGRPFTAEEERDGVVGEIMRLCSFENLSNLEVNKTGIERFSDQIAVNNREFFRKGETGDWRNYLSDEMKDRLNEITEKKWKDAYGMKY